MLLIGRLHFINVRDYIFCKIFFETSTDNAKKTCGKCSKKLTLSNNCNFVRSSKIIVQLKMEHVVLQLIFDQPL